MIDDDQMEQLARYIAGDLPAVEAFALEQHIAERADFQRAIKHLRATTFVLDSLPLTMIAEEHVEQLVGRVMSAAPRVTQRAPRLDWSTSRVAVALAAVMLLALGVASLLFLRPSVEVLAGTADVDGKTLSKGQFQRDPNWVTTSNESVAVIRKRKSINILMLPQTQLQSGDGVFLSRGAVVALGQSMLVKAGQWKIVVSGEAVISREPLAGDFRETEHLTPKDVVNTNRIRKAASIAALTVVGLSVYVLSGTARVSSKQHAGETTIDAKGAWGDGLGSPAAVKDLIVKSRDTNDATDNVAEEPNIEAPMSATDGALDVRVVGSGVPIANARVRLYWRGDAQHSEQVPWLVAGHGVTDKSGLLRLNARAGAYLVSVRANGWPDTSKEILRAQQEMVTKAEVVLVAGERLGGRAIDSTQQPVAPVIVSAHLEGAPPQESRSVSADNLGRFVFEGLSPGRWIVRGEAPGRGKASALVDVPSGPTTLVFRGSGFVEGFVRLPDGGIAAGAEVHFLGSTGSATDIADRGSFSAELIPGEWSVQARLGDLVGAGRKRVLVRPRETVSSGDVVLGRSLTLSGKVSVGEKAVLGATVEVSGHSTEGTVATGNTDPVGQYTLTLPKGSYDVLVTAPGHGTARFEGLQIHHDQTLDVPLSGNGRIAGVAKNSSGNSVEGVVLVATAQFRADATRAVLLPADGRFELSDLPIGRWVLSAQRDNDKTTLARVLLNVEAQKTVETELLIEPPGEVRGTLVYQCAPLPSEVHVYFISRAQSDLAATVKLKAGQSQFSLSLPPGRYSYEVEASPAQCVAEQGEVSVESDKSKLVSIQLQNKREQLSVTVIEADGKPSPGASVEVKNSAGLPIMLGTTDADGVLRDAALDTSPGQNEAVLVQASKNGRSGQVRRPVGASTSVTVTLGVAASLTMNFQGAPEGARIEVETHSSAARYFDQQQTIGKQMVLDEVPAGTVFVAARTGKQMVNETVSINPGENKAVNLQFSSAATVTGRLVDAKRKAVAGWVGLMTLKGEYASRHQGLDESGRFSIVAAPGQYQLNVMPARVNVKVKLEPGATLDLGDVQTEPAAR